MTPDEAWPAFERLCKRLYHCSDPDDGGRLYALSRDLEAISESGDTLSGAELAEDVATLQRLVAEGTVPREELIAFVVIAADVRDQHAQLTPLLLGAIREVGYEALADEIHARPAGFATEMIRSALFNLTMRDDYPNLLRADYGRARAAVPCRWALVHHRRGHGHRASSRRASRRASRASPARPGDDDPPPAAKLTPLQAAQQQLAQSVLDAREFDEREFAVFIDFAAAVIAREAARVTAWEQRQ